jgi:hypothetical protein
MVVTPFSALVDVGYTWQTWGGVWGGRGDPVHFEYPGFVVPAAPPSDLPAGYSKTPWWGSILSPGPWWAFLPSYPDLLKKAVKIEKSLGFDEAINWLYRTVGENPDAPRQ